MDSHDIVGAMHQSLQVFQIAKHSLRHSLHCLTLQLSHRHSIVRVYRSSIGRIVPLLPHDQEGSTRSLQRKPSDCQSKAKDR